MKPELHRSNSQTASAPGALDTPPPAARSEECDSPGCYWELGAEEFLDKGELVVFMLKITKPQPGFQGFRQVVQLECAADMQGQIDALPEAQPIGLVCCDGTCSARLAIRLSRQGRTVFHLAGGLWEWNRHFRGQVPDCC